MEQLPPLSSLITFDAFYRAGSVTAAAERLGRTHSAVSKQLHLLQDHAGVELFVKRGLHIELTKEGRAFAQAVAPNLEEIRQAYSALCCNQNPATVTVAAGSTFARHWLIPTIAKFNVEHPEIDILIRVSGPQGTPKLEGPVDLVISWDRLMGPEGVHPASASLGDVHIGPVISPDYHYQMTDTELTIATVVYRRNGEAAWPRWCELSGLRVNREREISFDLLSLALEAAERGMGAAMAPKFLLDRELKGGTLIAPSGFFIFKDGLRVQPSADKPKMGKEAQLFFNWLVDHARLGDDGFIAPTDLPGLPSFSDLAW